MIVIDASLVVQLLVLEQFSNQARDLVNYWRIMGIRLTAQRDHPQVQWIGNYQSNHEIN